MVGNEIMEKEKKPEDCFFHASAEDFKKIPGLPLAYWVDNRVRDLFLNPKLDEVAKPRVGMTTGDNDRFLRSWWEVDNDRIFYTANDTESAIASGLKWFPANKGGEYRKWFGNNTNVVNWLDNGKEILSSGRAFARSREYYFQECITWSAVSSSFFGFRYSPSGFIPITGGSCAYPSSGDLQNEILPFLSSKVAVYLLQILSSTLNIEAGDLSRLPLLGVKNYNSNRLISIEKYDWDSYETSWCFSNPLLLYHDCGQRTLNANYHKIHMYWQDMMTEMQNLEEENNLIFIEAYGLQDELTPDVPLNEITLTCNPHYRYGGNKTEEELEALLLADTMREFISYAVGCMFGRYSLDKEGLILANQGETLQDYLKQVPEPSFMPDDDNVIPLIDFDGDWFEDDITERFKQFLKITFGEEHFQENLRFIEQAIGKRIKKFFVKEFYTDHIKRYKKRPIYWQFSSPKGTFNALIYMHRYRPDTVSIVLNDYLREFRTKITARQENLEQITISTSASQKEKTQALKTIEKIKKVLDEINHYEHDVLYPLATQKIEIDLDDGVKHNYPMFGKALKKVTGLS